MSDELLNQFNINAMLDHLTRHGWVESWGSAHGRVAVVWTAKGRERVRWILQIEAELGDLGEIDYLVLLAIAKFNKPKDLFI